MIFNRVIMTKQTRIAGATRSGDLLINPDKFLNLPIPAKLFILAHEAAHLSGMRNETDADLFAAREMKKMGYSDRDVAMAQALTLSLRHENNARISEVLDYLRETS